MSIRISVITPSFNQASFLEGTLRSVLDQAYPALEYIVCDGGSTDGSAALIERYSHQLAWWYSAPDNGQTAAINTGFSRATGEVVGWLNSDDLLLPGSLEAIGRAFEDPGVQAICGWCVTIDEAGQPVSQRVYPQPTRDVLLKRSFLPQPTVWWRRELLDRFGMLDESLKMCMDYDYWTRLAEAGIVPKLQRRFLAAFRRHEQQKTSGRNATWQAEEQAIRDRVHGPGADRKQLRKSVSGWWRLKRNLMKRAAKLGLYRYRGPLPSA